MQKYFSILFLCLIFQSITAQTNLFDNDSLVQELIDNHFYFNDELPHKFSSLTKEQELDLFYSMIENPKKHEASYFKLFEWFLSNFTASDYKKAEMPPMDYALVQGEKVPAHLILEHIDKIPSKIVFPFHCDFKEVSPLYLASEMEDLPLLLTMIDKGIAADSLCYDYWLDEYYQDGNFYFFSKYNDTTYKDDDGDNVLNKIFHSKEYFYTDIPLLKNYENAYRQLLENAIQGINENIDELWSTFLPLHLKYEARKSSGYNDEEDYYYSEKLQALMVAAAFSPESELFKKLYNFQPKQCLSTLLRTFGYIRLDNEIYDVIFQDDEIIAWLKEKNDLYTDPVLPVYLIANNVDAVKSNANTQNFLLKGGNLEQLAKFYASEQTDSPEIFEQIAIGNTNAVLDYLKENNNPFVKDKYGLSMFDLLIYTGMEKPVLQICDENRFLPLSTECLELAIHSNNPSILGALAQKVALSDYGADLIHAAIREGNRDALIWLISNNISLNACLSSFRDMDVAIRLFNDTETLKLLLEAGLPNQKWEKVNGFSFFQQKYDSKYQVSLFEFAIANHFDKAVELMYPYFYSDDNRPEIDVLSTAAICGTTEMISFLMGKGLSANDRDSTMENISPIELATVLGNTDILRTMVENGADCHIKPLSLIKTRITDNKAYSLADISGSYSTLEYLKSQGCIFYPELYSLMDIYIDCWMSEKAKNLLLKYPDINPDDFMRSVLYSNNEALGIWIMDHYTIAVKDLIYIANSYDQTWFFQECMQNAALKDSLNNYRDEEGNTILHIAVQEGNISIVKALINNGFDLDIENNKGFTPYFLALQMKGGKQIADLMKKKGAKTEFSVEAINNSFQESLQNSDITKMRYYLEQGADPNMDCIKYYWGQSSDTLPAIFEAVRSYKQSSAEILLLYGANPNTFSEEYQTPLYQALQKNNYDAARLLIYKGADVNYVPKAESGYSCESQQPLIDKVNLAYSDFPLYKMQENKTDIDTEIVRVVKEDKSPSFDELVTYIQEEGYYYDINKIKPALIEYGSVKLFKHALDHGIIEVDNDYKKCALLKNLIVGKRPDLLKSLPDTFYAAIDLSTITYNDPIKISIELGKRYFSFNSISETINPDIEDEDISDETRSAAIEAIEYIVPRVKGFADTNYFKEAVKGRFYEAVSYFMSCNSKTPNEKQAIINIINKDNKSLQKQLDEGLSPNAEVYGFRLLSCAAWTKNVEAAELLIEKGGDLAYSNITEENAPQQYNRPVMWSFMLGDTAQLNLITDHEVECSYLGFTESSNVLEMFMAHIEQREWFMDMMESNGLTYTTGSSRTSFLSRAILWDDAELVESLLQYPPDSIILKNYDEGHYYIPKDIHAALGYAVEHSSGKVFFKILESADSIDFSADITEANVGNCENPQILKYLLDNNFPIENRYTYEKILTKVSKTNNNDLFNNVINKLISIDSLIFSNCRYTLEEVKNDLFETKNLEAFRMLIDAGMNYQEGYLKKAIETDNYDFIRYFLVDLKSDWIVDKDYQAKFAPDYSQSYETWLYTVHLIEDLIKVYQ